MLVIRGWFYPRSARVIGRSDGIGRLYDRFFSFLRRVAHRRFRGCQFDFDFSEVFALDNLQMTQSSQLQHGEKSDNDLAAAARFGEEFTKAKPAFLLDENSQ